MERGNDAEGVKAVNHDEFAQKFYITLGDDEAVLGYTHVNDILDVHTIFAPAGQEQLEQDLIKAVFDYAHKHRLKIIPTDEKISIFAKENEYEDMLTSI